MTFQAGPKKNKHVVTGKPIRLQDARAPSMENNFRNVKKIGTKFVGHLCHIQMLPANFETKMLSILACAKKTNRTQNVTTK